MALNLHSLGKAVRTAIRFLERRPAAGRPRPTAPRPAPGRPSAPRSAAPAGTAAPARTAGGVSGKYPGDFTGAASAKYAPAPNGKPEPGEIVWTWVPYEEDHSQGKDRPVLLIGSRGRYLLGLMLTSRDHDQDDRGGANYVDIGTGMWDRQGRPSEAKLDRILQISPADIRREGAILDKKRFDAVATALREVHGWN
ncbi:type II toxin-antitoxin system PemK/MazF family toxin [Arthrobacter sp. ISL-72]|uniref:type II toxin-antitoxin system PemK/MazF family toxin n=1 Tax=Arthrobacter sp. ISL-72 TaxID=2819114 RepID=UPI001BEA5A35|nr:type II toxin-antitoxin system PemK/MazF family toxin [Arthrobacter sp. ISL-72]MBT2594986.1 type II toxin-antitoxin system PemK/MazF family toxin [Arthrobacter sp. ISL-72]